MKNMSLAELSELVAELGEKRHRRMQILQWIYQKGIQSFSGMTNLPARLRERLDEVCSITSLQLYDSVRSREDESQKFLLESDAGTIIEAVLMDSAGRQTVCISSQSGCPLDCAFCRTGKFGYERNLRCDEMLNQILYLKIHHLRSGRRYNIVFMGMGEPLLNLANLTKAIEMLNCPDAFNIGEKRITVSTIGIPERIEELGSTGLKFSLAVSLNATTDGTRKRLMPHARGIDETLSAALEFATRRRTRVTLEYVLIDGVNDGPDEARRLASLTANKPFKINVIPFNEWEGSAFRSPGEKKIDEFVRLLLPEAPAVTVRRSQGKDIGAACGQLRAVKLAGDV